MFRVKIYWKARLNMTNTQWDNAKMTQIKSNKIFFVISNDSVINGCHRSRVNLQCIAAGLCYKMRMTKATSNLTGSPTKQCFLQLSKPTCCPAKTQLSTVYCGSRVADKEYKPLAAVGCFNRSVNNSKRNH